MTWKRCTLDATHGSRDGRPLFFVGYLSPCKRWHVRKRRSSVGGWTTTHAPTGLDAHLDFRTLAGAKVELAALSSELGPTNPEGIDRAKAMREELSRRVAWATDRDGKRWTILRQPEPTE